MNDEKGKAMKISNERREVADPPMRVDLVQVVRCRDCKHGHITINGKSCKWCDLIATHDIDGNEPNNGYDPEPYFDADFFCAWGKRKEDGDDTD